jgi:Flp pilus assembly pilin Flp
MLKHFIRNQGGAAAAEFAVILMLLMILTFVIMDLGYALWQWNNAEKAAQFGSRLAAISTPLAPGLATFECGTTATTAGQSCATGGNSFGIVTCTGTTCTGNYGFSQVEADRLLARMKSIFPQMQAANLVVEYRDLNLAFDGRGSPVASVTVRIVDMTFDFLIIDGLLGMDSISMPDFRTTLTTEDLRSTG